MSPEGRDLRPAIRAAAFSSAAIIAFQVAGKATRDAFFLSTFDVTSLPAAVAGSAAVSIGAVLLASKGLSRWGPARLVPLVFATSAALLLTEWLIAMRSPRIAAAAVYLHFNALGALLISGYWSLVSERFDPRTVKQQVGRIGAAGTLGGLAGGVLAERIGASFPVTTMLPVLAGIHLLSVAMVRGLSAPASRPGGEHPPASPDLGTSGIRTLARVPYLRSLGALVLLAAITEGAVDYVFKARGVALYGRSEELMRLFAGFYTAAAVLTFFLQAGLSRRALEGLGLARTMTVLPATMAVGATGMLVVPGLVSATLARGAEAVLHNSLYRSGYELLFTPIRRDERRAVKPIVDVGCNRLGDVLGAGLVQLALVLGSATALSTLAGAAVLTGIASAVLSFRLHHGYVRALEKSLLARAVELDLEDVVDSTTRTAFLATLGGQPAAPPVSPGAEPPRTRGVTGGLLDQQARRMAELRSGDPLRVRRALAGPVDRQLVTHLIPLLGWDEVASEVIGALGPSAPAVVGQLTDALLDPDEQFAVRRRIPEVLAACRSERAAQGLLGGLEDTRFEVRYRCGRALARLHDAGVASIDEPHVFAAVLREVNVGRSVWASQRLLDRLEGDESSPFVDEFLRDRASRSLEHVFTLLSLVLPRQPLTVAFRGLHTDDQLLRGTALEYLESVLPPALREKLWPFLEDRRTKTGVARPREAILADLLRSNQSIALNLEALRRKAAGRPQGPAARE